MRPLTRSGVVVLLIGVTIVVLMSIISAFDYMRTEAAGGVGDAAPTWIAVGLTVGIVVFVAGIALTAVSILTGRRSHMDQ